MAHHLEDNCIVPSLLTFKSNQTLLVSTVARNKGAWEWWRAAEGERQREREILALCGSSILLSWGQTNKKTNSKQTKILSAIYRGAMFFKPINPVSSRLLRLEFSKRIHTHTQISHQGASSSLLICSLLAQMRCSVWLTPLFHPLH